MSIFFRVQTLYVLFIHIVPFTMQTFPSGRIQYTSVLMIAASNKYLTNPNLKELSLCFLLEVLQL